MSVLSRVSAALDRPLFQSSGSPEAPETEQGVIFGKSAGTPVQNIRQLFGTGFNTLFGGENEYSLRNYKGTYFGAEDAPAAVFISSLMNTVMWITVLGAQAELRIVRREDMKDAPEGRPVLDLLAKPTGNVADFTFGSLLGLLLYGNQHWHTPTDRLMRPTACEFMAPWLTYPDEWSYSRQFHSGILPTKVNYWRAGQAMFLPADVMHLRWGLDLYEPRLGFPPPRQILNEVLLDAQAGGYSQEVLQNLGFAANFLIPEVPIDPNDAEDAAKSFHEKFGPGKRGGVFVPSLPLKHTAMKADVFQGADLKALRNISEERAGACYRVHPGAIGHGTGMDSVKVGATMSAVTRYSWDGGVVPPLDAILGGIHTHLFPLYGLDPMVFSAIYDPRAISALREDPLERRRGLSLALGRQPHLSQNEARKIDGHDRKKNPKYDEIPELNEGGMPPGSAKPKSPKKKAVERLNALSDRLEDFLDDQGA